MKKSIKYSNRLPKNKTVKTKSTLIKKTQETNKRFTIMTFNVELFLRLYDFITENGKNDDADMIQDATIDSNKLTKFKKLFANIDIACLQETYVSGESFEQETYVSGEGLKQETYVSGEGLKQETYVSGEGSRSSSAANLRIFDKKIRHLELKDICTSHILDWPNALYLYGDSSYLANAIYVSKDIPILQKSITNSEHNIHTKGLPRCFSMATVFIDTQPIKVVSVHLIGGRFDDIQAIQNDYYIEEKLTQIKAVVAMDPDIICGDFNTKFRTPAIETATDLYFDSIVEKMPGVSQSMRAIYKSRWDKWIYMDTIHKYLKSAGYKSVYHSAAGTLHTRIQNTSSFGGIVDMIYYKSNKLQLDVSSVDIVGYNSVMKERETLNTYDPVLSDHYPVKATFSIILR